MTGNWNIVIQAKHNLHDRRNTCNNLKAHFAIIFIFFRSSNRFKFEFIVKTRKKNSFLIIISTFFNALMFACSMDVSMREDNNFIGQPEASQSFINDKENIAQTTTESIIPNECIENISWNSLNILLAEGNNNNKNINDLVLDEDSAREFLQYIKSCPSLAQQQEQVEDLQAAIAAGMKTPYILAYNVN